MYFRGIVVRLADYVVSYSLQINNRCLRYLAECYGPAVGARLGGREGGHEAPDALGAEPHTVFAESLLARDSRRLASMWALMQPGWRGEAGEIARHVEALGEAAVALTDAASCRRLALRLAALAGEDHEAEAILKVARKLPGEVAMTWEALNELYAADSHFWRVCAGFKALEDDVIQQRVCRSYRKAYRHAALMGQAQARDWLDRHGGNLHRWVQLAAHQLELLRPGLSEKGKAQLWYLDKMSDTLRTRTGLRALRQAAREVKVKKAAAKLVGKHIEQQVQKMDKRIVRLAQGCFPLKPKHMDALTKEAVGALGLRSISLVKERPRDDGAAKTTTDNAYG